MNGRLAVAWRFVALGGLALGLAAASLRPGAPAVAPPVLAVLIVLLVATRPRGRRALPWLSVVAVVAVLAGSVAGSARLEAIDAGAMTLPAGDRATLTGTVVSTPRTSGGTTRLTLAVAGRRIGVEVRASAEGLDEGRTVVATGTVREPAPWEAGALARNGAARVLVARRVRSTDHVRAGLRGALDGVRRHAETALEHGTPAASAALLRGFVLGQDDRIPEPIRDEFRRSGLAHVLAVSGQNVMLLALLATPLLALAGVPIRLRLLAILLVIAVYVPVAGAGASIQRAGVMGAAGLVAALAGRPRAGWYALLLAAALTLALNPRAAGDIGWQLSFAAVAGLLVLATPLARIFAGREPPGIARRVLAEGMAMTVAATLATAPLAAHHFGTVSLTALPANLLALPAIAPAMWLGMLSGALGQVPSAPVEPLTALGGLCAGFIGWVAHVCGGEWAQVETPPPGITQTAALSCGLVVGARLGCAAIARRSMLRPGPRIGRSPRSRRPALALGVALILTVSTLAWAAARDSGPSSHRRAPALSVRVMDVGQGDAILLQPRAGAAILIDTGPPGGGAVTRLVELGIAELGAAVLTHDQLDHVGALGELLGRIPVGRLVAAPGGVPDYCRTAACPPIEVVAAGHTIRSGQLRLRALWPRAAPRPRHVGTDPNARSLVLHARLGEFDALLTGDAESELASYQPPPVDVLKVAHHGSADTGLQAALARAAPGLAVISVGEENPYGHPAPETLAALEAGGVPVLRTDQAGELVIEVRGDGWTVE